MISERVPEFTGRGSRCFLKCLGTRTLYLGQRGKPARLLESAKGSFAESRDQTPGSLASGSRRRVPWRLALESEKDSCLSGETDFEEAFTPSFDPMAQHINRGVGLAPKTSRNSKPCAGNPVPSSLSSVIVFVVLGETLRRFFFTTTASRPSCCRNSSTTSPVLLDQEGEDVIELNVS